MTAATRTDFDLAVLGGGPGGYVAALRAAQLGLRTALVEREHLGGICLNWGCIPTKSLLHGVDLLRQIRDAQQFGLSVPPPVVDLRQMVARSRDVSARLNRGVGQLLRKAGVTVFEASAAFAAGGGLTLSAPGGERRLQAARVIVATGARPRPLPGLPFDGDRVWSYKDALQRDAIPPALVIVGAGAIGLEFASFYAGLGSRVTLVEARADVLPDADADVSAALREALQRQGIAVHVGTRIREAAVGDGVVRLVLDTAGRSERPQSCRSRVSPPEGDEETSGGRAFPHEALTAPHVLVAIGLQPNVEALGLEHTRVALSPQRSIVVDGWGATADPAVYAVGDVTGAPMLAHRASHQGMVCVERIAGRRAGETPPGAALPACTYGHPQTASVGLSEAQARAAGRALRIGRFPLAANGKALAIGAAEGFVKTLFDADSGALLGAHIVGHDAPELIHGFCLAATLESTEAELMDTVFPHPAVAEAMHESVLLAFDRPLHI